MLVVAVVAVAYGSAAPQLAVAEFSPSAQKALDAPPTTAGDSTMKGGSAGSRRSTTTSTVAAAATTAPASASASTTPTTKVGRARPCYGNPPRQTEDPMAPACMPYIFEGDNGGATSRGVSATEIRIGIPGLTQSATDGFNQAINAIFAAMNQSFELYGRRLVPVYVPGSYSTATTARATAANTAAQGVFGAITAYAEWLNGQQAMASELARQHVVTVVRNSSAWWTDRTLFDLLDPYVWSVNPSSEDIQRNMADFGCRALAGHTASHAGDASLVDKTRRFGIAAFGIESAPSVSVLAAALEACTGQAPVVLSGTGATRPTQGRSGYEKLRSAGVTTMFCVCEGIESYYFQQTAHSAGFHPEWIFTGGYAGSGSDEYWLQSATARGEIAPPIRLGSGPRLLPFQARPWYPLVAPLATATTSISTFLSPAEALYAPILVLAAGIQAAGPQLTPETFGAGLMSTQFPNPGAGQPPYWQPSAGFGPGDHSFYDDYNVAWWSNNADALDIGESSSPKGSWCYLGQAARFRPGTYPANADELLFNPNVPCR